MPRPVRQNSTARAPLAEAERKAQNLETQIATLSKLLNAGTGGFWPAVTEEISVAKGYEAALGAALGDDLDASTNPASPAHWAATDASDDPALPPGVEALAKRVTAPAPLDAAAEPDRRRPAGGRRRLADSAETRTKARLEGRRSVALGRVHPSRRSPDPGSAAACRKKPPRRSGDRGGSRARRRQCLENGGGAARKRRFPPPPPPRAKPGKRIKTRCAKSRSRATKKPTAEKRQAETAARLSGARRSAYSASRPHAAKRARSAAQAEDRPRPAWNCRCDLDRAARHRARGGGPGSCHGGRSERRTAHPICATPRRVQNVCRAIEEERQSWLARSERARRPNRRSGGAPRGSDARAAEAHGGAGYVFARPAKL